MGYVNLMMYTMLWLCHFIMDIQLFGHVKRFKWTLLWTSIFLACGVHGLVATFWVWIIFSGAQKVCFFGPSTHEVSCCFPCVRLRPNWWFGDLTF